REFGLELIDQSLELNPNYDHSWLAKGEVLEWMTRPEEALQAVNNALTLNPGFVEAWMLRADLQEKLGRFEESDQSYKEALRVLDGMLMLSHDEVFAVETKEELLLAHKRYDEALVCYDRSLSFGDEKKVKLAKARILLKKGDFDEALKWLDALLLEKTDDWETYFLKGTCLQFLGRKQEALAFFDKSLKAMPTDKAICAKADILADMGRYEEAMICFGRPNLDASVLAKKGEIEVKFGDYDGAVETLTRATEKDHKLPSAWYWKGMAHLALGKFAEAGKCFDNALGIDKRYVWAWLGKAKMHMAKGNRKKALRYLDATLDIDPDFKDALKMQEEISSEKRA
ncbi:MAG: tetratricopeptide repeat protein, partial [Candidatus Dadabacteria bacterium]|nr:tetratricopeptide repeat protein [Candidatus Dadabacteria bacterium]